MTFLRAISFGLMCCAAATGAGAADREGCLSPDERRVAMSAQHAISLGRAMRVARSRIAGEVVKARLCRQEKGLVYVLTVLARDGKVMQARVDAVDGRWLGGS